MTGLNSLIPFVEAVEEYSKYNIQVNVPYQIVNQGLNAYLQLPHVQFAALFVANDDTLEFEFKECLPFEYSEFSKKIYSEMVNDSTIGVAITNKNMNYSKGTVDKISENAVAIPLFKTKGILGIVILKLNKRPEVIHDFTIPLANIHSSLFSSSLENCLLRNKNHENKQMMEQMVAQRTLDLVNSKRMLAEKIGNLQNSLTTALPHELRTPINQIMGSSDFILKHQKDLHPEEITEMVSDIRASAQRLKRMTENYLYFSHLSLISTNFAELLNLQNMTTVSAGNLLKDIVNDYAFAMSRENDFICEIEDADICMSSEFFDKMIVELIDNAIKYSEPHTKICIQTKVNGDMFDITICDKGRGFSNEQIEMIDAYVQFERKSFEQQGAGLGLAIVSKIVHMHKGHLCINSNENCGTEVIISLPICK